MSHARATAPSRRPTNVTLPEPLLHEARALKINVSHACERGLAEARMTLRQAHLKMAETNATMASLIGKTFLYALAAGGEAGVGEAINILRKELSVSMALTGVTDVADVDRRVLR